MTGAATPKPCAFGLIVIGDEVLVGGRSDRHFAHFKALLAGRGHTLAWHWLLPDDPEVLTAHLRFSLTRPEHVFCCGGIGATPDDHTRACAAAAAGLPLARHPEAAALIEGRFGDAAYPNRVHMADLPDGCGLIANPYNQIPGFRLAGHHFLPGFPEMAWPMAEAVLDARYPGRAAPGLDLAVLLSGVPESELIPLMSRIGAAHPGVKVYSLPHLGPPPHILLGVRGHEGVEPAFADLCAGLEDAGIAHRPAGAAGAAGDAGDELAGTTAT